MSFTEHLAELRTRLLRSVVAIAVAFVAGWTFHEELFRILSRPVMAGLRSHGIYSIQAIQVTEAIGVYLDVALIAAVVLAMPYVLYQAWSFVAPGLYPRERRYVFPVVGLVSAFFLLGIVFAYFVFMPMVVDYLIGFTIAGGDITLQPTVERTFAISWMFLLIFGIVFEMPLLMFFLALLGVVDYKKLLKFGRYFVVLAFIAAAILTPPDPLSQTLMGVPLAVLYFVGVAFAYAAGLLRAGGSRTVSRAVGGGVFGLFAASVVLAAWLWTNSGKPAWAASVPSGAAWALRADHASPIGRAALPDAAVPEDTPATVRSGPPVAGVAADFSDLDAEESPFVLVACGPCAAALLSPDCGPGLDLTVRAAGSPRSLASVALRLRGDADARAKAAAFARSVADGTDAGRSSALGRVLARAAGDFEVSEEAGALRLDIVVTAPRAARIVAGLVSDLAAACGGGT